MKLFERFDKTYLINLDNRTDRLKLFEEEVIKYNLGEFVRFSAIDGMLEKNKLARNLLPGEIGIILSNLEILNEAKLKKYETILIIEDDCYFTDEINNIQSYFDSLPNDWNMLYFGGNHNTHIGFNPPKQINDKIIKLHNTYSAHLVGIKNNLFDELIFLLSHLNKQLDVVYSEMQKKYNVYSFFPAIAKQRIGFSDIQKKTIDYNWLIT